MKKKTILIVEDEPMTREGLFKALESWSASRYAIEAVDNGYAALRRIAEQPVDLLVTDIRMPEISGLDLVKRLEQQLGSGMPSVVLISGYAEFEYAQQAIQLGVVNYLLKPVSNGKLIEAVEQALLIGEKRSRLGMMEKIVDPVLLDANQMEANDSIKDAVRYIDEHLAESFGLQEVADHVHLSPSYFSVLFKEQMGLTFSDYLTRRRLQRAKEMLVHTKLPVVEIALRVGYKTGRYFNRIFKEYENCSPGQYRAQFSEER
jgi:YesN/AraC family two-component response regulator